MCLRGVFADWVDTIAAGIERNLAEPGPYAAQSVRVGEAGSFFDDYCNWQRVAEFRDRGGAITGGRGGGAHHAIAIGAVLPRPCAGQGARKLLVEAAQHDPARFAELYEYHFARVYAYIVRRVRDRAETEDLTSEVFHHALANLQRFEWRGIPFAAWLYRIAANLISDRWQRLGREPLADEPDKSPPRRPSTRNWKTWSGEPCCSAWSKLCQRSSGG